MIFYHLLIYALLILKLYTLSNKGSKNYSVKLSHLQRLQKRNDGLPNVRQYFNISKIHLSGLALGRYMAAMTWEKV